MRCSRTWRRSGWSHCTVLFQVADHADSLAKGEKLNAALIARVTSRLSEIGAARAALTTPERTQFIVGYWADRHIEQQKRLNLRSIIERAGLDAAKLREVRSSLTPLLRDTLVGLNYAYYAPPGAELLRANPVFVRSHDFIGSKSGNVTWQAAQLYGSGWPSSAGGRLVGSLAGLPYALADTEQNFLVPTREQALIWGDLAPQILISAKVPRWWNVSYSQMHWLALHVRYGTSLAGRSGAGWDVAAGGAGGAPGAGLAGPPSARSESCWNVGRQRRPSRT